MGLKKFFKLTLLTILVSCATENMPEVNYADEFKSILAAFETSSILDLEDAYFEKVDFGKFFQVEKQLKNVIFREYIRVSSRI